MKCLIVDDDRKFSYKLSTYIDNFLKGIFKSYQVVEINEKFDDFSQWPAFYFRAIKLTSMPEKYKKKKKYIK